MTLTAPRQLLRAKFDAAVTAAMPGDCVTGALPPPPKDRTIVVGAGKASAAMAQALEGLVVTRYGHRVPRRRIEIVEAAHPVPKATAKLVASPQRSLEAGIDSWQALANNDAHTVFAALGDQIVTGPTLTNVNDFRAIYVAPPTHSREARP